MKIHRYLFLFVVITMLTLMSNAYTRLYSNVQISGGTATPTKTPITATYEFKRGTYNTIPPQNIITEIAFFGGGGGVICNGGISPGTLDTVSKPKNGVLMTQSTLIVCGWDKGEVLKGKVIYPNGKELQKTITAVENETVYYGRLDFTPSLTDPIGNYTFVIGGKNGTAQATASFSKPTGPHLFRLANNNIMIYGYSANEKVKLLYFDGTTLYSWQEYTMDNAGQSIIKISVDPKGYFWAIGRSGEAQLPTEHALRGGTVYPLRQSTLRKDYCSGLLSRLTISMGISSRVAYTDGNDMRIRSAPGLSSSVVTKVPEGTDFTILDGPKCADGITWWKIRTQSNNISGWVAESDGKIYLLEPLK